MNIEVQDTSGQTDECTIAMRARQYQDADAFMLCFAVDQQDNDEEMVNGWVAEIRNAKLDKPILVLLMKKDLLSENEDANHFTEADIRRIREKYDLQQECFTSSMTDNISID